MVGKRSYASAVMDKLPDYAGTIAGTCVKAGLEGIVEGLRQANPLKDAANCWTAARNIAKKGVSWNAYKKDLRQGKYLGAGNGAQLALYGGLLASGLYVPFKAAQAVTGAGASLVRTALTSDTFNETVGRALPKTVKQKLARWKDKKHYREQVAPKVKQAALALTGQAPLVLGQWGAEGVQAAGSYLKSSSFTPVKYVGKKVYDLGTCAKNAFEQTVALSTAVQGAQTVNLSNGISLANTVTSITDPQTYQQLGQEFIQHAGNTVQTVGSGLESIVTTGINTAANGVSIPTVSLPQLPSPTQWIPAFDGEEKYALLIAGYDSSHEGFPMQDQAQEYRALLKAGFKPENIYVIGPDGPEPWEPGARELARAYQNTNYRHDCTKENIARVCKEIAEKADSNDTFVCAVSTHGNASNAHSYFAINNGNGKMSDTDFAEAQKPIRAGAEYNFILTCQAGNHPENMPPITANWGAKTGVIAECTDAQNAQAYSAWGTHLFNEIAKNGIDANTNVVDLARRTDLAYTNSFASWNSSRQDPVIYDSATGNVYVLETSALGRQTLVEQNN